MKKSNPSSTPPTSESIPSKKARRNSILAGAAIGVLSLGILGMGTLNVLSARQLSALQGELSELKVEVAGVKDLSASLSDKADQLSALEEQQSSLNAENPANAETQTAADSEEQGTLSPSSGDSLLSGGDTMETDADLSNLLSQLQGQLPVDNGTWSVYVANVAANSEGSINNAPMKAASLIKLYIMGAVYEQYDALAATYGSGTLDSLLYSMITVSDNDAANTLTRYLGGGDDAAGRSVVTQFCQNHGYVNSSMGRMLLASTEYGDNYTSVMDCGRFLLEIYQSVTGVSTSTTLSHTDSMYNLLCQQQRRHKIPAQMPDGVGVANKTGELDNVENDAAIVYNTAKGQDLIIVFMSQDLGSTGSAQGTISSLSRSIYSYYNE